MNTVARQVLLQLQPLIGLPLAVARRAADLRNFQFGAMRTVEGGSVGDWALHIQCPWRIEGPEGLVTGRSDLWRPVEKHEGFDWDTWDYEQGNLQDHCISALLVGADPGSRSLVNTTGGLFVQQVTADDFGGAVISLSGGYRIAMFPAGSRGEDWRVFQPETEKEHFVIRAGIVETE
jgi:hypothetical protein